ncbi:MAG: dipeptidase [Chloroflexota bacterium]
MTTTADTTRDAALEAHLDATAEERLDSYRAFLRFPSISALAANADDCLAAAQWLSAQLEGAGAEHVEVVPTEGHPVVYADWLHAEGAPTVIVYGHYDVQPVDPLDEWASPPFEPAIRDGRIVARGAADDKGQIHLHLMALEGLMRTRGRLPVNVRYVFEGDEESNSAGVTQWLRENRERLGADVVVISDTSFFDGNVPAITLGLRGLMYAQIDVEGPPIDLHSGSYGGIVENPANALAQILAALKGPDGRIRIPGFYDEVRALTDHERRAFGELPFDEATYAARLAVPELVGEVGFTTLQRGWARPTLDVNGMWSGFQGEGAKTIIPARAHAKVSSRLVPDQDPDVIFDRLKSFVETIRPPGVKVTVNSLGGGLPSLTPMDHPATQATARAIERAFGRAPVYVREGGSIPVCASFGSILGLPVVLAGFSNPDDNAHAPNEAMVLDNYERGIRAVAYLFDELAALD